MGEEIIENIKQIQARITAACVQSGREIADVQLLLATKTVNAERIKIAIENGYPLIAENKVQEIKQKWDTLEHVPHQSHFIGHLQTNKIKDILRYNVSCIQSVDRLDLAQKLDQRLTYEGKTMDILIQVNTSAEESKFGVPPEEALALIKEVMLLPTLNIKGLMTIGLFSTDTLKVRACFKRLKELQQSIEALQLPRVQMKELSMGMSNDLEIAIAEGATIIRVGTAIFGQRQYPDSYYWNENTYSTR
ncbi:MAG: YggS family pyridoxal phosphate-dependent enzyme [Flavobacteriaceae bacterium]|jgi:pyridoxal phosphate enzyme (YggS family)|nr:YggS family pyridoxal phosphate-dependent enzyme [Flavobacteriaceae bacterium]